MNLEPLADRVVIRRLPNPAQANFEKSGLVIPDSAKNISYWGVIVAVGPGIRHHITGQIQSLPVFTGDVVLFSKYAGTEYQLPDDPTEYVCVKEGDLIGVQRSS